MAAQTVGGDAEAAGGGPQTAAAKPTRSVKKPALAVVAALALFGGVGGSAYHLFKNPAVGGSDSKAEAPVAKPPTYLDLPEVMVNLSTVGSERTQYLKVRLVLELADAELVRQIQPILPRVMDAFQVFLRELRPSDLDGSAGMYRLKEELTRRVNAAIAPNRVNAVLFKEMIVQ